MLDKIKNKLARALTFDSNDLIWQSWLFMITGVILFVVQTVIQVPLAPGLFFLFGIYLRIMALDWTVVRGE